jgi:excisionase family DNA binding protein
MRARKKAKRPDGRVKTLDEVAALLRLSRGSVYQAVRRKEIPTIRIGRRVLVPSDALEKLLSGESAIQPKAAVRQKRRSAQLELSTE